MILERSPSCAISLLIIQEHQVGITDHTLLVELREVWAMVVDVIFRGDVGEIVIYLKLPFIFLRSLLLS